MTLKFFLSILLISLILIIGEVLHKRLLDYTDYGVYSFYKKETFDTIVMAGFATIVVILVAELVHSIKRSVTIHGRDQYEEYY